MNDMPGSNGKLPRLDDTGQRAAMRADDIMDEVKRQVVGFAAVIGLAATLVGGGMYLAGRASAADLDDTKGRTIKLEQAFSDHRHVTEVTEQRVQRQLDAQDAKLDHMGEQLYRVALRVGAPATKPVSTIKPAPPEERNP